MQNHVKTVHKVTFAHESKTLKSVASLKPMTPTTSRKSVRTF